MKKIPQISHAAFLSGKFEEYRCLSVTIQFVVSLLYWQLGRLSLHILASSLHLPFWQYLIHIVIFWDRAKIFCLIYKGLKQCLSNFYQSLKVSLSKSILIRVNRMSFLKQDFGLHFQHKEYQKQTYPYFFLVSVYCQDFFLSFTKVSSKCFIPDIYGFVIMHAFLYQILRYTYFIIYYKYLELISCVL